MASTATKASAEDAKRVPIYRTYSFVDKDPIIDVMRTLVHDSKLTHKEINERCGVSRATLGNWFNGKTRRPQFCTIAAVAGSMGKAIGLVNKKRD